MDDFSLKVKRTRTKVNPGVSPDSYWYDLKVPIISESMSVLDALIWSQANADASLAFRCACRVGMCGTCGVVINGRERLACKTLVANQLETSGGAIRVEPLRRLPVVRDLVTDPEDFFRRLTIVKPNLSPAAEEHGPAVITPDSRERQTIAPHRECIYCGLCYSACSMAGPDREFLGPAAINRAFALVEDSRDQSTRERLAVLDGKKGIWSCRTIFECTAVCPKGIPITLAFQKLKRRLLVDKIKGIFRLGRRR